MKEYKKREKQNRESPDKNRLSKATDRQSVKQKTCLGCHRTLPFYSAMMTMVQDWCAAVTQGGMKSVAGGNAAHVESQSSINVRSLVAIITNFDRFLYIF